MKQIVILGGGIIGLSIAYELTRRNLDVCVIEKSEVGTKASWAGAGMLPPMNPNTAIHPLEKLTAASNQLHSLWSEELSQATGVNNQYRKSGSLHLAKTLGETASLIGLENDWRALDIEFENVLPETLASRYPYLGDAWTAPKAKLLFTPSAAQFHNRAHLQALEKLLTQRDTELYANIDLEKLEFHRGQEPHRVSTISGQNASKQMITWEIDQLIIAAGPWSAEIVADLGIQLPMQPVRGQMVGYQIAPSEHPWVANAPTINEGSRYLVVRSCGSIVAGSTIEEAGFECHTTDDEIARLRSWAESILPCLQQKHFVGGWAGLRPATFDGFPYLGRPPGFDNVLIAAGHFKGGLQLSTGTAVVVADLVQGKPPQIDMAPFAPGRVQH